MTQTKNVNHSWVPTGTGGWNMHILSLYGRVRTPPFLGHLNLLSTQIPSHNSGVGSTHSELGKKK